MRNEHVNPVVRGVLGAFSPQVQGISIPEPCPNCGNEHEGVEAVRICNLCDADLCSDCEDRHYDEGCGRRPSYWDPMDGWDD